MTVDAMSFVERDDDVLSFHISLAEPSCLKQLGFIILLEANTARYFRRGDASHSLAAQPAQEIEIQRRLKMRTRSSPGRLGEPRR
jgi:hypothetical protein